MADYALRSIEDRKRIETMWEKGYTPKELAAEFGLSMSATYNELSRGQDGTRLPDQRLRYSATLAQCRVQRSLERRGPRNRSRV